MQILGYDDVPPTNNPTSRPIDYAVTQANIDVDNPETRSFDIDPGATITVVDGVRSTDLANDTELDLTLSPADPGTYRITWTGGTNPVFRTDRTANCSAIALTLELQTNLTLKVTAASGTPFASVVVGDDVFIPGAKTGDSAGPFNSLNEGFWEVVSGSSTVLVLKRDSDEVFEGISEIVTPASAYAFQAFSSTGVQVGDTVDISDGFATSAQRSFDITAVTSAWFEFTSTAPLGEEESVTPTTEGLVIYTSRKRFVGIRSNQEIVVRYNGDTGNTNRIDPLLAGIKGFEGSDHKFGTVWKLVIYNRSSVRATVRVATAE
jgi:hypothetical protein